MRLAISSLSYMEAKMVKSGLMSRLFWIGSVEDRQVHFAVGKMDRAVFCAVHLFHFEYSLVEVGEPVRLVRENREMSKFCHYLPPFFFLRLKTRAITGLLRCQCIDADAPDRVRAWEDDSHGVINLFSQTAKSRHEIFSAETHRFENFFLGEAAGSDIQHELLRTNAIRLNAGSLDTSLGRAPGRHDCWRLFPHGSARLFRIGLFFQSPPGHALANLSFGFSTQSLPMGAR